MPTRIDHVIAAAGDFPALEAAFGRLGFHVTGGGTHPHLGTRNRIIVLGEGYLELLGIADAERASPAITRRLASGGSGWVGFALQSDDIAAEAAAMRSRAADVRGPHPGRLVSPNGTGRSWRVLTHGSDDLWASAEPVPFLIQHDSAGAAHQTELAGEGSLAPHANGALRIQAVTLALRSRSAAEAAFARVYALHPRGAPYPDETLRAEVRTLPLPADGEYIELATPAGPGIVQQRIALAGEGVCSLAVAVASLAETRAFLSERGIAYTLAHGALWIEPAETLNIPLRFVGIDIAAT
ncbi:MAG TPA: VOC family protein [Ktedonobacterales bacterium]|nr:VOC family protein [Ktedonobacterales bacterium]